MEHERAAASNGLQGARASLGRKSLPQPRTRPVDDSFLRNASAKTL